MYARLMKVMEHPVFGGAEVDPAKGISWQKSVRLSVHDVTVRMTLSDPAQATVQALDVVAPFVIGIARFDAAARDGLRREHETETDSNVSLYREHHLEELSRDQVAAIFGAPKESVDVASFLSAMHLVQVHLYPAKDDGCAVFDYTISQEATQYLLVVSFDRRGEITSIEMES